jgi:hypothetical protein
MLEDIPGAYRVNVLSLHSIRGNNQVCCGRGSSLKILPWNESQSKD